jgi:hypothetical protein
VLPTGLAAFVNNREVIVWRATDGRFHEEPLAALDGAGTTSNEWRYARPGSVVACRLPTRYWPGARDDVSIPAGKVELVHPDDAAQLISWVEEHPRDPDQSLWHSVWRGLTGVAAWVSSAVGSLFGAGLRLLGWIAHLPIICWIVLPLVGLVTTRLRAGWLNRILTLLFVGVPVGILKQLSWTMRVFGWDAGARWTNSAADGLFGVGGFVVTLVTGLERTGDSTLGGVVIALGSDLLLAAKPLALGAKLATLGDSLGVGTKLVGVGEGANAVWFGRYGVLNVLDNISDFIMVRPATWVNAASKISESVRAATMLKLSRIGVRIVDTGSLIWRPMSALNECVDQVAAALRSLVKHVPSEHARTLENVNLAIENANQVLHAASGTSHVNQLATTGTLPTAQPPPRLRRFPGYVGPRERW